MKGIGIVVGMQVGVIGLKVLHNYVVINNVICYGYTVEPSMPYKL